MAWYGLGPTGQAVAIQRIPRGTRLPTSFLVHDHHLALEASGVLHPDGVREVLEAKARRHGRLDGVFGDQREHGIHRFLRLAVRKESRQKAPVGNLLDGIEPADGLGAAEDARLTADSSRSEQFQWNSPYYRNRT